MFRFAEPQKAIVADIAFFLRRSTSFRIPCFVRPLSIMPLPANDAFTLGLPHDPSRPSYSLGLHSSSSTLPFVKGSKTTNRNTSSGKRLMSAGRTNVHDSRSRSRPHANDNHNSDPARPPAEQGKRKDLKDPSAPKVPVDWEIPRKILHSSIGMCTVAVTLTRNDVKY